MRLALPLVQRSLQTTSNTILRRRAIVIASSSSSIQRRAYQTAATTQHSSAATLFHRQDRHSAASSGGNVVVVGGGGATANGRNYTTHSQLPSEHQMVYEMCRKFADEELSPNAGKWDKEHAFPVEAVNKLVRKSWLVGWLFPMVRPFSHECHQWSNGIDCGLWLTIMFSLLGKCQELSLLLCRSPSLHQLSPLSFC